MTRVRAASVDWPAVAAELAQRFPHTQWHPGAMVRALTEYRRESRGGGRPLRWAVAFSGGADSLALLLLLWAEGPGRWGRDLVVLHFNHRLRGRAAEADEAFCRRVSAALGVTFVSGRWAGARRDAGEAEARAARLAFFRREMTRRRLRLLWLAHQQDDVAETLLMRLARGSGTGGLAAPRPAQAMPGGRWHLRPLLTVAKAEMVDALRAAGATWREDASNATGRYFRNRVRADVLPAWGRAAGRDAVAGAARSRDLLDEDDAALEAWLDELRPLRRGVLELAPLAGRPQALMRRALHRWLLAVRPETDLARQGFELLLAKLRDGRDTRFSLGKGGFAVIREGRLRFQRD